MKPEIFLQITVIKQEDSENSSKVYIILVILSVPLLWEITGGFCDHL